MIPTYQAADTLPSAIASALAQTAPAHEVIVVDDGSTDGTVQTLAPFRDRIVYLHQENRGTAKAFNAGTQRATGEFVAVLDADDIYEPERLEAMGELAAERPDLDIVMTDAYLEAAGEIVGTFCQRTPFAQRDQSVAIFDRCFVAWPAVRRTALVAVGGFAESLPIAHDWDCWLRMLHAGSSAGLIEEPLMRYRIAGKGSLTDDRVAALRDRVRVLERASQLELSSNERRALERVLPPRRQRALLAEAEQALRERRHEARQLSLEIAREPGVGRSVRLKALAATVAPRTAARWLDRREARTGSTRIRRGLPGT